MRMQFLSTVAAAVAASLALVSCGGGGGGGETTTTVVTPPVLQELKNARYVLTFVDAVSGATINDPLNVKFVGGAALKAADGSSLNDKSVATSNGLVFVNADFSAVGDDFSVQVADAGSKGWQPSGVRIVGTAGQTGDRSIEVRMINVNAAAAVNASSDAVTLKVATGTVSSTGALAAPVLATTPTKTVTTPEGTTQGMGVATVAIDAGTIGKTASGAPAAPGPLTVANTYFSNATVDSLAAFPGGFAATVEVPAGNAGVLNGAAPDAGTFVTAGFAQFSVTDSAGNAVKTFDKPLALSIDMPKGTLDANGNPLAVGSTYPVWSYDDNVGTWKFETIGTVAEKTPVDPVNFGVKFQTRHLSTWALSTYMNACTMNINLLGRPTGDTRFLRMDLVGNSGQRWADRFNSSDSTIRVVRAPNITGTIVVKDGNLEVGRVTNRSFCGAPIDIPLTLGAPQAGTVRIETTESCADGSNKRAVPAAVSLRHSFTSTGSFLSLPTYTSLSASNNGVAETTLPFIPAGNIFATAQYPRTNIWFAGPADSTTVTVGGTTVVRINFPMTCQVVSGGV